MKTLARLYIYIYKRGVCILTNIFIHVDKVVEIGVLSSGVRIQSRSHADPPYHSLSAAFITVNNRQSHCHAFG
jgi:hypothetical protein